MLSLLLCKTGLSLSIALSPLVRSGEPHAWPPCTRCTQLSVALTGLKPEDLPFLCLKIMLILAYVILITCLS